MSTRTALTVGMIIAMAGCGGEEPSATAPPLARPEAETTPVAAVPAPEDAGDAAGTELLDAFREAMCRELDELDHRHGELERAVAERPELAALVEPLLSDIATAIAEVRGELEPLQAAAPGELISLQARLTSRVGDIAAMIENATAIIEQERSAPIALPELGDIPDPESRPSVPK